MGANPIQFNIVGNVGTIHLNRPEARNALNLQMLITGFLGGTGLLIIVGVALDLVDKVEAQLLVRQYEGFMRAGSDQISGRRRS